MGQVLKVLFLYQQPLPILRCEWVLIRRVGVVSVAALLTTAASQFQHATRRSTRAICCRAGSTFPTRRTVDQTSWISVQCCESHGDYPPLSCRSSGFQGSSCQDYGSYTWGGSALANTGNGAGLNYGCFVAQFQDSFGIAAATPLCLQWSCIDGDDNGEPSIVMFDQPQNKWCAVPPLLNF